MVAKSPPQVETEVSRTGFPVRQIVQPHDGFFIHDLTFNHTLNFEIQGLGLY